MFKRSTITRPALFTELSDHYATQGLAPYHVGFFGSHPDKANDDCYTGSDYATEALARVALAEGGSPGEQTPFSVVFGPGLLECYQTMTDTAIKALAERQARDAGMADRDWLAERAEQAGMGLGCAGYNDVMGY